MVGAKALKGHSHKLASFHTTKLSITVSCKGDVLYSTTTRIWVPIFYWCVVRCGSKNVDVDQKDVFLKEIGLRAQNMFTIPGLLASS